MIDINFEYQSEENKERVKEKEIKKENNINNYMDNIDYIMGIKDKNNEEIKNIEIDILKEDKKEEKGNE